MKKFLFLLLLTPILGTAQFDTTKFYRSPNYGDLFRRAKINQLMIPGDTTTNKVGIAQIGGVLYSFGSGKWNAIGSADTTILASKAFTNATYALRNRAIVAGYGLAGGGDLSADRSFIVDTFAIGSKPFVNAGLNTKYSIVDSAAILASKAWANSNLWSINGNSFTSDPIFGTTNNRNIRLFANNLQVGTLVSTGNFVMGFTEALPWSSGELIQANGGLLSNGNIRAYNGFIRSNPLSGTNCGEFRVGSNASWLTAYNDVTGGGICLNNTLNNGLLFTPSNGAILKTPDGISFNGNNTDAFSNMRVFTSGKVAIGFNNSAGVPNQGTINNTSGAMLAVVGDDGFQNTGRFIQSGDTTYNVTSGFDLVLDAKKYGHTISFDGASLPYKDSLRIVLPNVSGNGLNGQEIVLRFGGSNGTGGMFIHKLKLLALDGTQSPIVAGPFDGDRRNQTTISVYSGETIKLHFIKAENKWWADASSVFNRGEQLLTNSGIDFAFPAALYNWTKKTILPNLSQNRNLVIDTALEYKNREAFTIVNNNNTSFSYNLTGELVYDNLGNTVTTLRNNSTAVIESINNKWVLNYYETYYRGTQTQRLAMSANIGDLFYQTNGTEGAYVYKSTGWAFAY